MARSKWRGNLMWTGAAAAAILLIGAWFTRTAVRAPEASPAAPVASLHGHQLPPVAGPVPDWLAEAPEEVREIYAAAYAAQQDLRYIPCYCGCGSVGHRNNSDCFFKQAGGRLIYEMHGFG